MNIIEIEYSYLISFTENPLFFTPFLFGLSKCLFQFSVFFSPRSDSWMGSINIHSPAFTLAEFTEPSQGL